MRTGWFLAMLVVAFAVGCQESADKGDTRGSVPRYSSRPRGGSNLDYDSYGQRRSQNRLQQLEDRADAEQDGLSDEELTAARPRREGHTTRRPSGAFGTEEEEPEELARNRSDRQGQDELFKLGTAGRLDEESLEEDQSASEILSDDEDDPRRR